jgi:non-ribosomal peptide synthetase component E (peptide arylation enzyme)
MAAHRSAARQGTAGAGVVAVRWRLTPKRFDEENFAKICERDRVTLIPLSNPSCGKPKLLPRTEDRIRPETRRNFLLDFVSL